MANERRALSLATCTVDEAVVDTTVDKRQCEQCKTWRQPTEFHRDSRRPDGLHPYCKPCRKRRAGQLYRREGGRIRDHNRDYYRLHREAVIARTRAWQQAHADTEKARLREAWLKHKYGLTQAEYDQMLAEQGGVCICGNNNGGTRLAVDHDHETGVVRGLLCRPCNTSLGALEESPERLRLLADYLERWQEVRDR